MATIGSILVELRANTAKFSADMDKARRGVKQAGGEFDIAKRKAENFAEEGLEKIIPVSGRVSDAIIDMVGATGKGAAALQLFAKGFIVVTGALAVAALVQQIQHWVRYGETIAQAEENLKKMAAAQEEERKALARRQATANAMLSIEQQLARARSDAQRASLRSIGDEPGEAFAALQQRLAEIDFEAKARERSIFRDVAMGTQRDMALAQSNQIALNQRLAAHSDYSANVRKLDEDDTAKRVKLWHDETRMLADELKARIDARKEFEQQLGQGAPGGSTTAGFAAIREFQEMIQKRARDIAFLERERLISQTDAIMAREEARQEALARFQEIEQRFGRVPAVMGDAQRAIDSIQFGNFGAEIERGRQFIDQFIATNDELRIRIEDLGRRIGTDIPAGVDKAAPAIQRLTDEYVELAWAVYAANVQIAQANRQASA